MLPTIDVYFQENQALIWADVKYPLRTCRGAALSKTSMPEGRTTTLKSFIYEIRKKRISDLGQ